MLINVAEGEECRIALLNGDRLEELYVERTSTASHVGNIYKGRVTNVEASIQAAFVDFGVGRNGFLHISDLLPTYFGGKGEDVDEYVGKKMARRDRPPIQRCLRRGDEIVVQVIKEGIGTKGPTLSSYLSISGKMLVMMPGVAGRGVSKKIEDEEERRRLKRILTDLRPPEDCGFIIRTEAVDKGGDEIERDLRYLARLWDQIKRRRDSGPGPVELYTEGDLVTRTVRDVFSSDVERVVVDHPDVADRVRDVIRISSPKGPDRVEVYDDPVPLFSRWGIEHEIEQMYSRHVPLPSGGSLVIDSTEAVVTIDVNSGKMRDHSDAEMTAFKTDMEAAEEIPRQLKLRDLGGVIICDFIDLRYERHRRELEETLFENFKDDRAKTKVLRMSQFGIIELTRQRMRPSLKRAIYFDCPHCKGAGLVKTPESMALELMRRLAIALNDVKVSRAELNVCADVAFHLLNKKRAALTALEQRTNKAIIVKVDPTLGLDEQRFELFDSRDGAVILEEIGMTFPDRAHTSQLGVRPPGHTSQGRGGRGGDRGFSNDNGRRGGRSDQPRLEPARALDPEDDEEELDDPVIERGEADVENRERQQGYGRDSDDGRRRNTADREADRTDMPAILETEAGDEVADELADEEVGGGQSADRNAGFDRGPQTGPTTEGAPGEGGGRRRRRRRRRGRHGGGFQQDNTDAPARQPNEPNGNVAQGYEDARSHDEGDEQDVDEDRHGDDDRDLNEDRHVNEDRTLRDERDDAGYHDVIGDGPGEIRPHPMDLLPDDYVEGDADEEQDEVHGIPARHDGAVGTFNDVEPADRIGPAAEGGDSIAEDALNTRFADGPATEAGEAGEGGGRRRRRRRRGGRNRNRDQSGEPTSAEGPSTDGSEIEAEPVLADDADAGGPVYLTDADAIPVGQNPVQATVAEAEVDESIAEIAANESEDEAGGEVEEAAPAPKRKRPSAAKAKVVPKPTAKVAKKTAKKAVAKAAPKRPVRRKPAPVADAAGVVKTGTADTHVVDAEETEPVPSPTSYGDLDSIPDDYD